ncbi:MAG: SLBB domain-containing protein, partial [Acidobacteriia bacterium]|nr:SLBB domain-containing protein [Terriglobia bacterium]
LTVTPEGTLIIPTVGEIRVTGLKLAKVKERVLEEIRLKYMRGNPSVTLLSPRDLVVTVTGNVRYPGRYVMSAAQRVDRLLQEANKAVKKTSDKTATEELRIEENPSYQPENASKRSIVVRHRDGTSQRVDVQEYFASRNETRDPFLQEGDEVFVPRSDNAKNLFAVYGAVNAPGRFEYIDGDSVLQALALAYGLTKRANLDSIDLVRMDLQTGRLLSTIIRAKNLFPGSPENFPLEPGDRILAREKFDLRQDYRVFVEGEVKFPGIYPITKENTRLSQVIQQAGGLTGFASLQSSQFRCRQW